VSFQQKQEQSRAATILAVYNHRRLQTVLKQQEAIQQQRDHHRSIL